MPSPASAPGAVIEMRGLFITGTGTGVGKTFVTCSLALALRSRLDSPVLALKPIETGCDPEAADADALARAAGHPPAMASAFYRARAPVSPFAAAMMGEPSVSSTGALVQAIAQLCPPPSTALVEGAGGLLVPLDRDRTIADLARALELPLLIVASDELGVLSSCLTSLEAARARGLRIAGVVLTRLAPAADVSQGDSSVATNLAILQQLAGCPVLAFPHCPPDAQAMTHAALASGLLPLALQHLRPDRA